MLRIAAAEDLTALTRLRRAAINFRLMKYN